LYQTAFVANIAGRYEALCEELQPKIERCLAFDRALISLQRLEIPASITNVEEVWEKIKRINYPIVEDSVIEE
jgi:hypothetical protein